MNIEQLYKDYNIQTSDKTSKHYREGWIQTRCPFCNGNGFHLGYNKTDNYFNCYRCGWKSNSNAIGKLLKTDYKNARKIIKQYQGNGDYAQRSKKPLKVTKYGFKIPNNRSILSNRLANEYMNKRGFSNNCIRTLINDFGISYTSHLGMIKYGKKEIDLRYRILAPIYHDGEIISWQTRSIQKEPKLKYITCPEVVEKKKHKHILYHAKFFTKSHYIILTEGIFDVWKLHLCGLFAGSCFGVKITNEQIQELTRYKKVFIWFDPDKAGIRESNKLIKQLLFAGIDCIDLSHWGKVFDCDPGDLNLKDEKINELIAEIHNNL